ncbi:MAG: hypothetical protein ACREYE_04520 [Gammaproteobacteria bacterium]
MKKLTALGISRSGGARNPHVFQYTLRFLRSGGTRPPFARDGFFTNSERSLASCTCTVSLPSLTMICGSRGFASVGGGLASCSPLWTLGVSVLGRVGLD